MRVYIPRSFSLGIDDSYNDTRKNEYQIGIARSPSKKGQNSIPKGNDNFVMENAYDNLVKISKKHSLDDISNDKSDFLNVDQMITPASLSFENEHDYQLVLSDIF